MKLNFQLCNKNDSYVVNINNYFIKLVYVVNVFLYAISCYLCNLQYCYAIGLGVKSKFKIIAT